MRQSLRVGAVALVLVVAGVLTLPWAWERIFPSPVSEEEAPAAAEDLTATIEAVNQVVGSGLGSLGVVPEHIVSTEEEARDRDGIGWTFTRTTLDLPEGATDAAVRAAFDRWPDGVDAFLTRPDELTYSLRIYASKVPLVRLLMRQPLDPDPAVDPEAPPRLAVVVKGVGLRSAEVERMLELDLPLTLAVLPYRSHSLRYADDAARASMEVMAHLPFDEGPGRARAAGTALPEPPGMALDLPAFRSRLAEDVEAVPFASGVLSCSRSPTARDDARMAALGETLSAGGLYLLDDALYPEGVALQEARRSGVAAMSVTSTLDTAGASAEVERALLRLRNLAVLRGEAVVSVELGPGGAAQLHRFVGDRRREGYQIVFVSELIQGAGSGSGN
ncbi:MAG: divergent polysaccharide deacetylase family protein [Myxococcota bacterium]|nr:divergent polysaccharide deacetylase family protein [Myxococcota bacterium]